MKIIMVRIKNIRRKKIKKTKKRKVNLIFTGTFVNSVDTLLTCLHNLPRNIAKGINNAEMP